MRSPIPALVALAASLSVAATASAQPQVINGTVTARQAGAALAPSFDALVSQVSGVGWIGYSVPVVDSGRQICCGGWNGGPPAGPCNLEPETSAPADRPASAPGSVVRLEGSASLLVLFRIADGQVHRVRPVSGDCTLDAGGRTIQWLEGVRPADSLALLERVAGSAGDKATRVTDGAIAAIALHADPGADAVLDRLSAADRPEPLRRAVPFWLGTARGAGALTRLQRILREDPSPAVRKAAIFGLSRVEGDAGTQALLDVARHHQDAAVRGDAIFWLAQRAGNATAAAISERIAQDPDEDVKKKAVFALSQLPPDEGLPLLMQVARSNKNPNVRKQAMFWLGQSKDPRALDFIAGILTGR
jgi:HEAT repeat protein